MLSVKAFSMRWFTCVLVFFLKMGMMAGISLLAEIEYLTPSIVAILPHDSSAFTQGLVIDNEELYESTGLYGQSSLRQIDLQTGQVVNQISLPAQVFGEGLAYWQGQLIQLTWKEGMALFYQCRPLNFSHQISYAGEGWGLCADGQFLLMTNGTSRIFQRQPHTLAIQKTIEVRLNGKEVPYLNDLICVGNDIYANVWRTDTLIRIDKETGNVTGIIDASGLMSAQAKALLGQESVLNGIAYRERTGTFFITGKRWPFIFEVRFVNK